MVRDDACYLFWPQLCFWITLQHVTSSVTLSNAILSVWDDSAVLHVSEAGPDTIKSVWICPMDRISKVYLLWPFKFLFKPALLYALICYYVLKMPENVWCILLFCALQFLVCWRFVFKIPSVAVWYWVAHWNTNTMWCVSKYHSTLVFETKFKKGCAEPKRKVYVILITACLDSSMFIFMRTGTFKMLMFIYTVQW